MNFARLLSLCGLLITVEAVAIINQTDRRIQLSYRRKGEKDYVVSPQLINNYVEQRRMQPRLVDHVVTLCSNCLPSLLFLRSHNSQDRHER